MNILFLLTYYRPHWTGLTQYAARLAEGLVEDGHKVEVLTSQHKRNLPREEIVNGVKVFRVPYLSHFLRSVILPSYPFVFWRILKNSSAVVVFLPLQEIFLVTVIARLFNKKMYLVHNGDLVLPKNGGYFNRIVEKVYFLGTSFGINNSDKIIIHTEDYASNSKHLSKFKEKWKVILPPFKKVEVSRSSVNNFKRKYNLEGKLLIGFSGRFVEEKGVDYLLKAIPLIIKEVPNAHFIFCGEHKVNYENFWLKVEPLIKKYKRYLTLLGLISQPEVFIFYKSLEVLVIPSRTDCFPFAQVESQLSGTPSVCTDIPGARWIIKVAGMGLLVKPRNVEALAEGIVNVIKNRNQFTKNYYKVNKLINYQNSIRKYEELLESG